MVDDISWIVKGIQMVCAGNPDAYMMIVDDGYLWSGVFAHDVC